MCLAFPTRCSDACVQQTQLALAVRVPIAAIVAYATATALGAVVCHYGRVMTSLIVTQMSVGRSLKAPANYSSGLIGRPRSMAGYSCHDFRIPERAGCWRCGVGGRAAGLHQRPKTELTRPPDGGDRMLLVPGDEPCRSARLRARCVLGACRLSSPGLLVPSWCLPSGVSQIQVSAAIAAECSPRAFA